jgi:hypothetical protein
MDHGSMGAGGCAVSGSQPFTIVTEGASPLRGEVLPIYYTSPHSPHTLTRTRTRPAHTTTTTTITTNTTPPSAPLHARHVPLPGLLLRRRLDAAARRPRGRACRNELLALVQARPRRHAALPNIAVTPPHASAVHNGRSRSDPHTALPHHRHVAIGLRQPPRPAHAAKRLRRSGPTPNLLPHLDFSLAYAAPGQLAPAVQLLASLEDIQPRPHAGAAGPVHSLLAFLVGPDIHIGIHMWRRRGHQHGLPLPSVGQCACIPVPAAPVARS